MMNEKVKQIVKFLHISEKLKCILRHGWASTGRQESVAEHSWRLALMIAVCSSYLDNKVCLEKMLLMAIVHDLGETITGDTPYFLAPEGSYAREQKEKHEAIAWETLNSEFSNILNFNLLEIWQEYEKGATYEARVVKAFDKIEALLQQNEARSSTWVECEIQDALKRTIQKYCDFDSFVNELSSNVLDESKLLIEEALLHATH